MAVSGTGVGIVVRAPLVAVGAILGIVSLITLRLDKDVVKKITKNEKLISLGQAKLGSIQEFVSKALHDGKISEEEFKIINDEWSRYESQRSENQRVPDRTGGGSKLLNTENSQSTMALAEKLVDMINQVKKK